MSLAPGTRLGAYEITALIGAGGMGQVYRAHDARLNRDVAIKVLPDLFASDPDRLARFEREAQVLASLNHPHIAGVHGLEESNGIRGLVLELVDGPTLAERIADGPIPLDEALPIARQIVDALEAAHEKGIIHRDLKPSNIKLRSDGAVKVLDFGLAKVFEAGQATGNPSMSPTVTGPIASQVGVIMGTAAYMSPEQARGRPVDQRSDVWAFGCVVYEMFAGKPAFIGTDVTEILASVIKSEPEFAALPTNVPPRVRVVLQRCLQKDPKLRFQHIGDVRLALDGAFETPLPSVSNRSDARSRRRRAAMLAVAAAAIAAAAVWGFMRSGSVASKPVTRFSLELPDNAQWPPNTFLPVVISRDGRRIVYATQLGSGRQLYVHAFNELEPVPIRSSAGPSPSGSIFLSPDGESVGFNDPEGGTFKKLPVSGGPVITISRTAGNSGGFRGASWGSGGAIAFSTAETSGVMLLPEDGGDATPLTTAAEGETHWSPHFLPDGRSLLYEVRRGPQRQIAVVDVDSHKTRVLLEQASSPRFASSGHLLFLREGSIWAAAFDPARLEVTGDPVPVLEGVTLSTTSGSPWFDVARDGTLVFSPGTSVALRTLVLVDRQGREHPLDAPPRAYIQARFSPDGTKIAVAADDGDRDVWIWDGQRLSRFTLEPRRDGFPVWSLPDGHRLAFASERAANEASVYSQARDLTGSAERLTNAAGTKFPNSFTPDGKYLVFADNAAGSASDLKMLEVGNPSHIETLVATPGADLNGDVSPTGRWLAYQSTETGTPEIYVRPFPNVNDGRWQISTAGGTRPRWSKTGKELFYLDSGSRLMSIAVNVNSQREFSHAPPVRVLERTYYVSLGANYDVAPDGKAFLMIKEGTGANGSQRLRLNVVLNWTEELKRLARPR